MKLPEELKEKYEKLAPAIKKRIKEFEKVPPDKYFYEICFCLCTPQSNARNALQVVDKLEKLDFLNNEIEIDRVIELLRDKKHYIRFHNTKAQRLIEAKTKYADILKALKKRTHPFQKRFELMKIVTGFGMKESSHFLRNIGYKNLAILDRHILKNLVKCGLYKELPKINSVKKYLEIEKDFYNFSKKIKIPMDELDLLFWANETGEILK